MRIVIDLQGAQGASRYRGIGRYSLALAQAMVRNRGEHEILIALNGMFPDSIEAIRAAFEGLLPQDSIRVWQAVEPVHPSDPANSWRRNTAELMREAFLANLQPDFVHVTSLFEGFGDDAVHSIGLAPVHIPTAVTLYDLIPLIQSDIYLKTNPNYEAFYQEKLKYLKQADLYLAISNSSCQEAIDHLGASAEQTINISAASDAHFKPIKHSESRKNAILARFELSRPFVMYSGATDERKNHLRLIKAFSLLPVALRKHYQLAIVGGLPTEHRNMFENHAKSCGLEANTLVITGRVSDAEMVSLYNLCTLFVFPSWHEGFGLPALEAMSCGAPVISAGTSSLPEVVGRADAFFDPFDENDISRKITEVLTNNNLRKELARHGLEQAKKFSWDASANRLIAALEGWHLKHGKTKTIKAKQIPASLFWLIDNIASRSQTRVNESDWLRTAQAISQNQAVSSAPQLLVDISELIQRDAKSGIQRVVRSVLLDLLTRPPLGFRVEPVYATVNELGYRYARSYTSNFLKVKIAETVDEIVEIDSKDVFLGLDLQPQTVIYQRSFYEQLRNIGVRVNFVVYDLLPILRPSVFPDGAAAIHTEWLGVVANADGVLCISKSVADELDEWLSVFGPKRLRPLKLGWFHLGADVAHSLPTKGLPTNAGHVLTSLKSRPSFLLVGTLEPRKGQMQALLAFELLWENSVDVNLVVIGKQGWNVDALIEKLRVHPERNGRMFWLDGISDEYLEKVYSASDCLLATSEGEGFGLPLIEAAHHKKPIIARDISVFREIAKEHALYFSGLEPVSLANAVRDWLALQNVGKAPQSSEMPWLSWKESTQNLVNVMLGEKWYKNWMPDDVVRFWGADHRLGTKVGRRDGRNIVTTGKAGWLIFGPYLRLPRGDYRVNIKGEAEKSGVTDAYLDVSFEQGSMILNKSALHDPDEKQQLCTLDFSIDKPIEGFELRVWVAEKSNFLVSSLEFFSIVS